MTLQEAILEHIRKLSADDQKRVLEFVESLPPQGQTGPAASREPPVRKRRNAWGLFAGRGLPVTADEIDRVRRESWSNFPRELPEDSTR